MTTFPRRILVVVGVACILLALAGIGYNAITLTQDYSGTLQEFSNDPEYDEESLSHFYTVFYALSGICILFYLLLAFTGVQLIRSKHNWVFVLLGIVVVEVLYFFMLGQSWRSPEYGLSIAAASGVSSGGLMFQAFVLFPLWGPLAAIWARSKIRKLHSENDL